MAFDYKEETIADLEEKCTNYAKDSAQIAKQCEEYRQRCDRLSVIKERHERTIEELKKNGERLGSELLSKESVTKELRRFGEKLTSELASQKQIIVQLERKMNQVSDKNTPNPAVYPGATRLRQIFASGTPKCDDRGAIKMAFDYIGHMREA
uniref:Uncharacterized protein n=1 Tax=Steinernema glaseri TaxID=37863 RepID=A0A1I7Y0I8_9BILA